MITRRPNHDKPRDLEPGRGTIPGMRGKAVLAFIPVALAVGCGSATKTAATPAPVRTVTVAPSPTPAGPVLDSNAKLACSRIDDSLNAFKVYGDDLSGATKETAPLWEAFTFAETSATPGLASVASAIDGGGSIAPSDSPGYLVAHYPADASALRDWCVTHGWVSTSSSAS